MFQKERQMSKFKVSIRISKDEKILDWQGIDFYEYEKAMSYLLNFLHTEEESYNSTIDKVSETFYISHRENGEEVFISIIGSV